MTEYNDYAECCGTCRYHKKDASDDWICTCPYSEYMSVWTEYDDSCDSWEKGERYVRNKEEKCESSRIKNAF